MDRITSNDMEQINSYSRKELSPNDVYVFTIQLCDNDIDRDNERFTVESLFVLKKLFVGKVGIIDHNLSDVKDTKMRIISCEVDYVEGKATSIGEPYYRLLARAYIVKNDYTRGVIAKIEKDEISKVSIGCSVSHSKCSICHNDIHSPLCNHQKGKKYNDKLCFVELAEPTEAYEFEFVIEPSSQKVVTNYEKTMSEMTETKLATIMSNCNSCTKCPMEDCLKYRTGYLRSNCCYWCWLDWLNQEVDE